MSLKHLLGVESCDEEEEEEDEGNYDKDHFNLRKKSSSNLEENPSRYRGKQSQSQSQLQLQLLQLPHEINNPIENSHSADELFEYYPQYEDRTIFTGRMRKKQAARLKGGEFQARRQKRRVYFCCISSEINVQEFHEHCTNEIFELKSKWKTRLYGDALCLSKTHSGGQPITCEIRRRRNKLNDPPPSYSGLERMSFSSEIVN